MSAFALVAAPYIPFSQREGDLWTHRLQFVLTGSPNHSALSLALGGVDLDGAPGQIHGLIWPNGAGKTTLLNLPLGLD